MIKSGNLVFGGPIIWFLLLLFAIAFLGGLWTLFDLWRRPATKYGKWGRLVWMPLPIMITFGVLGAIIAYLLHFRPFLSAGYGGFLFFAMFTNIIQLPIYLLRVVFPTPKRAVQIAEINDVDAPEWAASATGAERAAANPEVPAELRVDADASAETVDESHAADAAWTDGKDRTAE